MIDYKKLGRVLDSGDQTKIDTLINVDTSPLISQYDRRFERHGFVEVKDNKHHLKMRDDARSVFQITKSIALDEINWLVGVISKLLSDDTEERLKKENDLIREDAQVDLLTKDKKLADIVFEKDNRIKELGIVNEEHQKLNGKLREQVRVAEGELSIIKGIGNNSPEMKKLVAELKEVKADNRKLAEQVDVLTHTPNTLRKKGLM